MFEGFFSELRRDYNKVKSELSKNSARVESYDGHVREGTYPSDLKQRFTPFQYPKVIGAASIDNHVKAEQAIWQSAIKSIISARLAVFQDNQKALNAKLTQNTSEEHIFRLATERFPMMTTSTGETKAYLLRLFNEHLLAYLFSINQVSAVVPKPRPTVLMEVSQSVEDRVTMLEGQLKAALNRLAVVQTSKHDSADTRGRSKSRSNSNKKPRGNSRQSRSQSKSRATTRNQDSRGNANHKQRK
jgi:hypothetical protein